MKLTFLAHDPIHYWPTPVLWASQPLHREGGSGLALLLELFDWINVYMHSHYACFMFCSGRLATNCAWPACSPSTIVVIYTYYYSLLQPLNLHINSSWLPGFWGKEQLVVTDSSFFVKVPTNNHLYPSDSQQFTNTVFPWILPALELSPHWLSGSRNKPRPWIVPAPCVCAIILVGVAHRSIIQSHE